MSTVKQQEAAPLEINEDAIADWAFKQTDAMIKRANRDEDTGEMPE